MISELLFSSFHIHATSMTGKAPLALDLTEIVVNACLLLFDCKVCSDVVCDLPSHFVNIYLILVCVEECPWNHCTNATKIDLVHKIRAL